VPPVSARSQPSERRFARCRPFPFRCSVAAESRESPVEVRQLLYGRQPHVYRILSALEGDFVRATQPSQNP
jgi:hypothetical protein